MSFIPVENGYYDYFTPVLGQSQYPFSTVNLKEHQSAEYGGHAQHMHPKERARADIPFYSAAAPAPPFKARARSGFGSRNETSLESVVEPTGRRRATRTRTHVE